MAGNRAMMNKHRKFSGILAMTVMLLGFAARAEGQKALSDYLRQYSTLEVSQLELQRLEKYNHLIEHFCSFSFFEPHHKVNPDFLRALILAESSANPKAISHKEARGLTQIIPETGKRAARELFAKKLAFHYVSHDKLRNLKPEDLYDPAVNILLACFLISKYNYTFKGRLDLVVSAWNAGEYSIVDNNPPPYRETMDLIGKVNGYYISLLQKKNESNRYAYRK